MHDNSKVTNADKSQQKDKKKWWQKRVTWLWVFCMLLFAYYFWQDIQAKLRENKSRLELRQNLIDHGTSLLKSDNKFEIAMGLAWLANLNAIKANEVFVFLKNEDEFVRSTAVRILGKLKAKEYLANIVDLLLNDKSTCVKSCAALAISYLGAREYSKDIAPLLKDENSQVRGNAIISLGLLKAKEYTQDISKLSSDKSSCRVQSYSNPDIHFQSVSEAARFVLYDFSKRENK